MDLGSFHKQKKKAGGGVWLGGKSVHSCHRAAIIVEAGGERIGHPAASDGPLNHFTGLLPKDALMPLTIEIREHLMVNLRYHDMFSRLFSLRFPSAACPCTRKGGPSARGEKETFPPTQLHPGTFPQRGILHRPLGVLVPKPAMKAESGKCPAAQDGFLPRKNLRQRERKAQNRKKWLN
jgi:hypothetical protein